MQNSIYGRLGNKKDEIKKAYLLAKDSNKIDALYFEYNNGKVTKIGRSNNEDFIDFSRRISLILRRTGFNESNKDLKWLVLLKNNEFGIDFNDLDIRSSINEDFSLSKVNLSLSKNNFSVNNENNDYKNKKNNYKKSSEYYENERFSIFKLSKLEELENIEDDYAIYKYRVVKDILCLGIMSFLTYSSFTSSYSSINFYAKYLCIIDALLASTTVFNTVMLEENKKLYNKFLSNINKNNN